MQDVRSRNTRSSKGTWWSWKMPMLTNIVQFDVDKMTYHWWTVKKYHHSGHQLSESVNLWPWKTPVRKNCFGSTTSKSEKAIIKKLFSCKQMLISHEPLQNSVTYVIHKCSMAFWINVIKIICWRQFTSATSKNVRSGKSYHTTHIADVTGLTLRLPIRRLPKIGNLWRAKMKVTPVYLSICFLSNFV